MFPGASQSERKWVEFPRFAHDLWPRSPSKTQARPGTRRVEILEGSGSPARVSVSAGAIIATRQSPIQGVSPWRLFEIAVRAVSAIGFRPGTCRITGDADPASPRFRHWLNPLRWTRSTSTRSSARARYRCSSISGQSGAVPAGRRLRTLLRRRGTWQAGQSS